MFDNLTAFKADAFSCEASSCGQAYYPPLYTRVLQSTRGSVGSVVHGFVALIGVSYIKGWVGNSMTVKYQTMTKEEVLLG